MTPRLKQQWNLDLTKCKGTGSLYRGFVISRVRYIEVLFHTLHYYWAERYRSLYRGLRYIEVPLKFAVNDDVLADGS